MAEGEFTHALDTLDTLRMSGEPDGAALAMAFGTLREHRPPEIAKPELERLFDHCYWALGLGGPRGAENVDPAARQHLGWTATGLIEDTFKDEGARNRDFIQRRLTRSLALEGGPPKGAQAEPVPRVHVPLTTPEARALCAPYLAALERQIEAQPFVHLSLCWRVMEHRVQPFDRVFSDWLDEIDARGLGTGDSGLALQRAFALATLAEEGRQKLTWENCESKLLPQLQDRHPLVAAAAGRFLGKLYSQPDIFFVRSEPWPMPRMLDHLRVLPVNRRVTAGGFLHGIDPDLSGPFHELGQHAALEGYDIDGWVLDILSQRGPEPYLPCAQSFWFYVHEAYCVDPVFVARLIDAGHSWVAMMCATEVHGAVEGMQPVLERLAADDDKEVAAQSKAWLDRHYKDDGGAQNNV